jgi:hypothetical protein
MAARKFSATWRSGAVEILFVAEIRHDPNPLRKFALAEKKSPWRKIAMAEKNRHGGNDTDDALEVDKLLT